MIRLSSAVICITDNMKNFLEKENLKCRFFVIPNFCETIAENPIDLDIHKEPIKIIYCGKFTESKGVLDLMDAFEKAKFKRNTVLHLFGSGVLPKTNKRNVEVKGWVEHEEYIKILPDYDFLALPSKQETFGLAYVEAMGFGLPVIGTFGPAIPEIIKNDETGILIDFGNIQQLTFALEKLANDRNLRVKMGKNAWADMKKRFTPEIVLGKLEDMYSKI